jgi:hypothetical protein
MKSKYCDLCAKSYRSVSKTYLTIFFFVGLEYDFMICCPKIAEPNLISVHPTLKTQN